MNRRIRFLCFSLLLLVILVGVPVWLTWRAVRQERLNHALITAIKETNANTVVSLLKQGADANAAEKDEQQISVWQVFRSLFMQIYPGGAAERREGYKALTLAAVPSSYDETDDWRDHPADPRIVKVLLDAGADPNCRNNYGQTPLHFAVHFFPTQVQHLLDKGADVNAADDNGTTVLMHVRSHPLARLLLDRGADVNAKDGQERSVLINMIGNGCSADFVRLLLDRGADPNSADQDGYTPLMAAVAAEDEDIVRLLLDRGAKVDAHDKRHGVTALYVAEHNHYTEIADLLKQAGAKE